MFEHGVGRIGDALAALVAALDPDAFSAQTASAVWVGLDRVERLAAAGKTVLARRAAQAAGGAHEGRRTGQSRVEKLARRAGTSVGAARDSVTTSQRLVDLPVLDAALRAGELSTAQAQLIASAATADPSAQERLVAQAPRVSLPELRDECARVRAAADPDPEGRNARLRAGRRLRRYTDPEGAWNMSARGTPQAGALFNAALDSIIDECFAAARAAGRREAYEAHAFDALMVMAQRATDPERAAPPETPRQRSAGDSGVTGQPSRGESADERLREGDLFSAALEDDATVSDDHEYGDRAGGDSVPEGQGGDGATVEGRPSGEDATGESRPSGQDATGESGPRGRSTPEEGPGGCLLSEDGSDDRPAPEDRPSPEVVPEDRPGHGATVEDLPSPGPRSEPYAGVGGSTVRERHGDESRSAAEASDRTRAQTDPHQDEQPASVVPVPSRPRRSNPRVQALLRVDLEAFRRGTVEGDELCEIAGVGPVPVSVARELLGDAVLKLVITRGVDVLNVTHLGRGPTAAQRVALAWTSPGCSVEGCWRTRVEIDHREDWARTRHTRLDELDHLCALHHDLKTRLGWALVPGIGKRAFVPPDDPRHPRHRGSGRADDEADASRPVQRSAAIEGLAAPGESTSIEGLVAPGASVSGSGGRGRGARVNEGDRPPPPPGWAA